MSDVSAPRRSSPTPAAADTLPSKESTSARSESQSKQSTQSKEYGNTTSSDGLDQSFESLKLSDHSESGGASLDGNKQQSSVYNLSTGGKEIGVDHNGTKEADSSESTKSLSKSFDFATTSNAQAAPQTPAKQRASLPLQDMTDDKLAQLCPKVSSDFQLHIITSGELSANSTLLQTLHSEGCALCLDQQLQRKEALDQQSAQTTDASTEAARYVQLTCKLLQCSHLAHLACLLQASVVAQSSSPPTHLPQLESFHTTSFFRAVPINDSNAFFPSASNSGGSRSHLNRRVYLELGVTHYASNAQILHCSWPQSFSTSVDISNGNEYVVVNVDGSSAPRSQSAEANVRSIGKHSQSRAVLDILRGRFVFKCSDDATGQSVFNVCNYDLTSLKQQNGAMPQSVHLVLVDPRWKNILTVGLQLLAADEHNEAADSQQTSATQYAVRFVRYEFSAPSMSQSAGADIAQQAASAPLLAPALFSNQKPLPDSVLSQPQSAQSNAPTSYDETSSTAGSTANAASSSVMQSPQFQPLLPSDLMIDGPSGMQANSASSSSSSNLPSLSQMPSAGALAHQAYNSSPNAQRSPSGRGGLQASASSFTPSSQRGGGRGSFGSPMGRGGGTPRSINTNFDMQQQSAMGFSPNNYDNSGMPNSAGFNQRRGYPNRTAPADRSFDAFGDDQSVAGSTDGGAAASFRTGKYNSQAGTTIARATGTYQHYGGNEVDDNPLYLPALPTSASVLGSGSPMLSLTPEQLVGNVVRFSKTHGGSRFVQQKLEEYQASLATPSTESTQTYTDADGQTHDLPDQQLAQQYFTILYDEMQYNIPELMIDNFAHFAVEKLFTACNDDQLLHLLRQAAAQLPFVACQKHGSFSVQALVDTMRTEQQISTLTEALENDAVRVVTHASGHFVLLRMLQKFPYSYTKFIDDTITNNCAIIGTDHHGLRVIKAILAIRRPSDLSKLFKQAARLTMKLVENQYGNYFIQALLDVAPPAVRTNIKVKMEGKFMRLSKQKFSSNVVEKCLKQSSSHWRSIIIRELIAQPAVGELLRDRYGNFVIQCSLTVANPQQVHEITMAITPYLHTLRENVKSKWQRLLQKASTGGFYAAQQQNQAQQQMQNSMYGQNQYGYAASVGSGGESMRGGSSAMPTSTTPLPSSTEPLSPSAGSNMSGAPSEPASPRPSVGNGSQTPLPTDNNRYNGGGYRGRSNNRYGNAAQLPPMGQTDMSYAPQHQHHHHQQQYYAPNMYAQHGQAHMQHQYYGAAQTYADPQSYNQFAAAYAASAPTQQGAVSTDLPAAAMYQNISYY